MKNKIYIVLIVFLGTLLVIQTAYIISLERSREMLLARQRLLRGMPRVRLQDDLPAPLPARMPAERSGLSTSFIMRQMPKEYLITLGLPGLSKDEINIKLKDKYLTVSVEKDTGKKESGKNYREEQVSSRSFLQVITLPDDARRKDITSEYKDGNLTIHIPKKR